MENNLGDFGLKNLKNELKLGKELAKQLKIHLTSPLSSNETRELLLNKILNSYDKALHMLLPQQQLLQQHVASSAAAVTTKTTTEGIISFESLRLPRPRSLSLSPRSDQDSDPAETPKKRKNMPRWTKHVQVSPGNGLEGPLDDGCSWRKYGQKDILGAKYPRGYYRCTLRHVQGCLATKQVQRTDDDPTVFEITYRGTHTCNQTSNTSAQNTHLLNQDPASSGQKQPMSPSLQNKQETLLCYQTSLKVRTENLEDRDFADLPVIDDSVLNFRSSSFGTFFGSSHLMMDNDFGGNAFPSLMDKDLVTPTIATSTNTTTVGVEFPIGQMEFPPNFPFHDNLGFFS